MREKWIYFSFHMATEPGIDSDFVCSVKVSRCRSFSARSETKDLIKQQMANSCFNTNHPTNHHFIFFFVLQEKIPLDLKPLAYPWLSPNVWRNVILIKQKPSRAAVFGNSVRESVCRLKTPQQTSCEHSRPFFLESGCGLRRPLVFALIIVNPKVSSHDIRCQTELEIIQIW